MIRLEKRVLVVDDDPAIRTTLARVLGKNGYTCDGARTCAIALSKLRDSHFDLAFVELELPDGPGLDLLAEIRKHHLETLVVMTTSVADIDTAVRCMKNGAADYLTKPINVGRVIDAAKDALLGCEGNPRVAQTTNSTNIDHEEFLHSVVQEIRTPLTAVIACSEMMDDPVFKANKEGLKALAGNISRSAWILNRNVQRLVDRAKDKGENPVLV